jgi:hypothetical protein
MSTLAEEIYAKACATALFEAENTGIEKEELTLIAAYAILAADTFEHYEAMSYEKRKKHTLDCAAKLAAAL